MAKFLVITGGSGGIGSATANIFSENDWQVINLSRHPCNVPNVINLKTDLSEPEKIKDHQAELEKYLQSATQICLVHNAGYQVGDTVKDVTLDELYRTLNVNVVASVELNKIIIPMMKPNSSIIYLGSMLAERGVPSNTSYIISKHAVVGLMRATCQDLVGRDIHTCCVCPGLVETRMLRASMSDELIDHLLKTYVVGGRLIKPSEIAQIIYNVAQTPAVNGSIVPANLGLVAA